MRGIEEGNSVELMDDSIEEGVRYCDEVKKILIVINSLKAGGAERVAATQANVWVRGGREVEIITFDDGSDDPFFELEPTVRLHSLGIAKVSRNIFEGFYNNIRRILILRRTIKKVRPDIAIGFMDKKNVLTLIATIGMDVSIIAAEHCNPYYSSMSSGWQLLRAWTYRRAECIVVLSQKMIDFFPRALQKKSVVIPNPVDVPEFVEDKTKQREKTRTKLLVSMGRLVEIKGFDMLLEAYAKIADDFPDWKLKIWGGGEKKDELNDLSERLGIKEKVDLPGVTLTPYEVMRESDLFVLSSRSEGFPNVLVEAMSAGLPAVSFDCVSSIRDIIRDGEDGLVVPAEDVDGLAEKMARLMRDEDTRQRMAKKAIEVRGRFGLNRVMQMWEDVFSNVVKKNV